MRGEDHDILSADMDDLHRACLGRIRDALFKGIRGISFSPILTGPVFFNDLAEGVPGVLLEKFRADIIT
jgi:hypothetical protein